MSNSRPPHILRLMSDEHAPQISGFGGDPVALTPNLDRLAAAGTVFDSAYCASPICVPGRYCILTGKLPSDIGSLYFDQCLDSAQLAPSKRRVASGQS